MSPLTHLALAPRGRPATGRRPNYTPARPIAAPAKRFPTHRAVSLIGALAGGLVLIVTLVDPPSAGDRFDAQLETQSQEARHE